jgi:LPXTG-motif cell wall-anchored protein
MATAQTLDLRPESQSARIGDVMVFHVTATLPPGMELIDRVPHLLVPPPRGIRLLSADTLRPGRDRRLVGEARMAFYRVGPQPVPTLALLYRRAPGESPDTLVHRPVSIEIARLLPAWNPPLKDLKPLRTPSGSPWFPWLGVFAGMAVGLWWLRRRRLARASARRVADPDPATTFDLALHRLDQLEQAARASGNGVVPLYAGVAEILRTCLWEARAIPHTGLTTSEVCRVLPPVFVAGQLGGLCEAVLADADLVKFARVRPDLAAGLGAVAMARSLLHAWRDVATPRPASRTGGATE